MTTPVMFIANPDAYSGACNANISIPAPGLLANDASNGSAPDLAVIWVKAPTAGRVVDWAPSGAFTYQPPANFSGECWGQGGRGLPGAPRRTRSVCGSCSCQATAARAATLISVQLHHATNLPSPPLPGRHATGTVMFIYAAMDRTAGVSDSAIVTLTIAACPSPPVTPPPFIVITPGPDNYSAPCNGSITVGGAGGLLSNDRSNSTNATLEVVSVGRPFPGGVIGAWDKAGGFTYTPPAGFQGALRWAAGGSGKGRAWRGHPGAVSPPCAMAPLASSACARFRCATQQSAGTCMATPTTRPFESRTPPLVQTPTFNPRHGPN